MKKVIVMLVAMVTMMMNIVATAEKMDLEETYWFQISFKLPKNDVLWVEDPSYDGDVVYINYDVTDSYDNYYGGHWAILSVIGNDGEVLEGPCSIVVVSYENISSMELMDAIQEQLAKIVGVDLEMNVIEEN